MMRVVLSWLVFAALMCGTYGCAHVTPVPRVEYRDVKVAVPTPCKPNLGPTPDYPDTDAKLKAATDDYDYVSRLVAGRLMRIARGLAQEAALAACAAAPIP